MRFMQTESVLQTKNRSGPAKNRFSVALSTTKFVQAFDPGLTLTYFMTRSNLVCMLLYGKKVNNGFLRTYFSLISKLVDAVNKMST